MQRGKGWMQEMQKSRSRVYLQRVKSGKGSWHSEQTEEGENLAGAD